MFLVLVTGSMGAGKSSIIRLLENKAFPVFKADSVAKEFLSSKKPCNEALKQLFSKECLKDDGEFDRKKLAQEIFKNSEKRKAMESILHPLVQESFKKFVKKQEKTGKNWVFYEAPLISMSIFDSFDKRILVTCSKEIIRKRLLDRGWTIKEIEERWAVQIPESQIKDKLDFIIKNTGDLKKLSHQLDKILSLMGLK